MPRGPCSCERDIYRGRGWCDAPGGCTWPGGPEGPARRGRRLREERRAARREAPGPRGWAPRLRA
eukprot:1515411-Alexandrium_andersonii.AAC.1